MAKPPPRTGFDVVSIAQFRLLSHMWRAAQAALLLTFCLVLFGNQAAAQCAPRDVMRNHPPFLEPDSHAATPKTITSAAAAEVWKTVNVGTLVNKWALLNALDAADCSIGDTAERIFINPKFIVSSIPAQFDLVVVSVAQLGIQQESATLEEIYSAAQKIGLSLAAAEIGPQLRLQYFDQPIGEFLNVGMAPITSTNGSDIFVVANGGAGLMLIGQNIDSDVEFHAASRFVFVRPTQVASHASHGDRTLGVGK